MSMNNTPPGNQPLRSAAWAACKTSSVLPTPASLATADTRTGGPLHWPDPASPKDISYLVGHSSTSFTETAYRHEIRPALTDNATAVNRILKANATPSWPAPAPGKPLAPQLAPET